MRVRAQPARDPRPRPPEKYLLPGEKVTKMKHYVAKMCEVQVTRAGYAVLVMTMWPANWKLETPSSLYGIYTSLTLGARGVTHVGKFNAGTPLDLWTWESNGKERVHVRPQVIR